MAPNENDVTPRDAVIAFTTTCMMIVVGMFTPILLAVLMWSTPDAALRIGDAGAFVSASTSAGGLMSPSMTSIQTSTGTLTVFGAFSALRGQLILVRDGVKS